MKKVLLICLSLIATNVAHATSLSFNNSCNLLFLESAQSNDAKQERSPDIVKSIKISEDYAVIVVGNETYNYELNDYSNSQFSFFVRKLNEKGVFRLTFSEPNDLYNEREEYAAIIECH